MYLTPTGDFHAGQLIPVTLDGEGHPSIGGGSVAQVRRLSQEDFGATAATLSARGIITRP